MDGESHNKLSGMRGRALFVLTILAGSFLLFLVQPMVARMALPKLGGAPAVWNSAMLVYQALLLTGYAYAHRLSREAPKRQAAVHLAVLVAAALWLPIGLANFAVPADGSPVFWVPWLLLASIGPLFFAVSAQAPLMQRWFGLAGNQGCGAGSTRSSCC
jgi:cation transport ATPase